MLLFIKEKKKEYLPFLYLRHSRLEAAPTITTVIASPSTSSGQAPRSNLVISVPQHYRKRRITSPSIPPLPLRTLSITLLSYAG
jgi:hypothetical protein